MEQLLKQGLSARELEEELLWGSRFKTVRETFTEGGRWTNYKDYVVQEIETEKYYSFSVELDACESCEGSGQGLLIDSIEEVTPVITTIEVTTYEPIKRN